MKDHHSRCPWVLHVRRGSCMYCVFSPPRRWPERTHRELSEALGGSRPPGRYVHNVDDTPAREPIHQTMLVRRSGSQCQPLGHEQQANVSCTIDVSVDRDSTGWIDTPEGLTPTHVVVDVAAQPTRLGGILLGRLDHTLAHAPPCARLEALPKLVVCPVHRLPCCGRGERPPPLVSAPKPTAHSTKAGGWYHYRIPLAPEESTSRVVHVPLEMVQVNLTAPQETPCVSPCLVGLHRAEPLVLSPWHHAVGVPKGHPASLSADWRAIQVPPLSPMRGVTYLLLQFVDLPTSSSDLITHSTLSQHLIVVVDPRIAIQNRTMGSVLGIYVRLEATDAGVQTHHPTFMRVALWTSRLSLFQCHDQVEGSQALVSRSASVESGVIVMHDDRPFPDRRAGSTGSWLRGAAIAPVPNAPPASDDPER